MLVLGWLVAAGGGWSRPGSGLGTFLLGVIIIANPTLAWLGGLMWRFNRVGSGEGGLDGPLTTQWRLFIYFTTLRWKYVLG